jgi:Fe2+ transport system protein FeoA
MRLGGIFGLVMLACGANASPVTDAVFHRDVLALEEADLAGDEALLAKGAALSLRHRDAEALGVLEPLAQSGAADLHAAACFALSDIYLRQTRYRDAAAALRCMEDVSPLTGEPLQVLHDMMALANEKPMSVQASNGRIAARRDRAGLIRVPVRVNGEEIEAVIDSDASFSVVSRSMARQLGLRILPDELSILTTARPDQPMQLALADNLHFDDAVLTHVVFAVLPDAATRFGSDYRMDAVIGLPVLIALRRISYDTEKREITYGPAKAPPQAPNLALSGLDPFVIPTGTTLRLALDTAADQTSLNASARLAAAASRHTASWQGAGGTVRDAGARQIGEWTFAIGDKTVTLRHVPVLSQSEDDRHGALGLDVLKSAKRWTIDFDAMCLWLAP